jgi:hypothetical protein
LSYLDKRNNSQVTETPTTKLSDNSHVYPV